MQKLVYWFPLEQFRYPDTEGPQGQSPLRVTSICFLHGRWKVCQESDRHSQYKHLMLISMALTYM